MDSVEYRDLPGFPGYRVGSDGSVWSCRLMGGRNRGAYSDHWSRLSVYRRPYGARYCVVCFRPEPSGKVIQRYVHRLVLEVFVGPCPDGMQACHEDGDTANNALSNLRWDTPKGNHGDKQAHNTHRRGSRSPSAKHVEMDILGVFFLRRLGFSQGAIGQLIGLGQRDVSGILIGKKWPHVRKVYRALFRLLKAIR